MLWRSLLVAALLALPVAYVGGVLVAGDPPVEERPALVLEREPAAPSGVAPRVTLRPSPTTGATDDPDDRGGDGDDGDDGDDGSDDDSDDDDGVTVVRPVPQDADDDDDDGTDDDDERDD